MPSRFLVYGLVDPRTGELRYVGKSTSGLKRPKSHAFPSKLAQNRTHCRNWICGLVRAGLKPEVVVLEESTEMELVDAERHYISYFRMVGSDLTNLNEGGGGNSGWRAPERTRRQMSKAKRGHLRNTEEVRAKMSASASAFWSDPEQRSRASRRRGGRPFRDETGRVYHTLNEAAGHLDLHQQNIRQVLLGTYRQTGGHVFEYLGE